MSSFNLTIVISLLISIGLITLSATTKMFGQYKLEGGLCGLIFFLSSIHFFVGFRLKSENRILVLSTYNLAFASANTVIGLTFLLYWGFKGFLAGIIVTHLCLFAMLIRRRLLTLEWSLDGGMLRELLGIGLPMMLITLVFFAMQSLDKIVVFAFLGNTATGYYGLAAFLLSQVQCVPYIDGYRSVS